MSMHAPLVRGGYRCNRAAGLTTMAARSPDRTPPAYGIPMNPSFAQFRFRLLTLGLALALGGCASMPPPTAELADAQQALVRAEGADADQYAGADLAAAREALRRAQSAMAEGEEAMARRLALAAAADADLAHARSREAVVAAELAQREDEINRLRERLQTGDAR